MKKKTQAFSLIELLVVIALIGVISAYGIPGLRNFTTNTGLTNNTNDLVASLQFARSAAIRLQDKVVVCSSDTSTTATPRCGSSLVPWHDGWIVFHDASHTGSFDPNASPPDELLKVQPGVAINGVTITPVDLGSTTTNIANYVSFGPPAGEPAVANGASQSGIFRVCITGETTKQRGVLINFSGRISSTRDAAVINSPCP